MSYLVPASVLPVALRQAARGAINSGIVLNRGVLQAMKFGAVWHYILTVR